MNKLTLPIKWMHCKSCVLMVDQYLSKVSWVDKVEINLNNNIAEIFYSHKQPSLEELTQAVQEAWYEIGLEHKPWITKQAEVYRDLAIGLIILVFLYLISQNFNSDFLNFDIKNSYGFGGMILVGLVAGFSTCMAVIGGLMLTLASKRSQQLPRISRRGKMQPQLWFQLGRFVSFALFGWLLGVVWSLFQLSLRGYGLIFGLVGVIMILQGVHLTELSPKIGTRTVTYPQKLFKFFKDYVGKNSIKAEWFSIGFATFFIPCGFTLAVQAYAATTGSFRAGAMTMVAFAIGTLPGIVGIGGLTAALKGNRWTMIFRFLGLVLIAFGAYNIRSASRYLQWITFWTTNKNLNSDPTTLQTFDVYLTQDSNGYHPNVVTVPKNTKVKFHIDSQEQYSCASSFLIPSKNVGGTMKAGENIFEFTVGADEKEIEFGCGMMMYRGKIVVK